MYLKGTILEKKDLQVHPPPPLLNKMQTVCNGWYYTLHTEPMRVKNTVCIIILIETFIFDRKADQY